jgi:hypothetical protein
MSLEIQEIAQTLRATESMALQFAERVQERVGQPVSYAEILSAMKKISAKTLSLEKVVAKVKEQQSKSGRKRTSTRTPPGRSSSRRSSTVSSKVTKSRRPKQKSKTTQPTTIMGQLTAVLQDNWNRAENEGLQPNRMSPKEFVEAVYRYSDRREASSRRILEAAKQLDRADVLLTPALVADRVHELFQS